jgi:hypothetical protein
MDSSLLPELALSKPQQGTVPTHSYSKWCVAPQQAGAWDSLAAQTPDPCISISVRTARPGESSWSRRAKPLRLSL